MITGVGVAILGIYNGLFPILNPTAPARSTSDSIFICALLLAPWLAELVLALRLTAVFPPSQTPKRKLAAILVFPVTIKCARLGCCIALCTMWIRSDEIGFDSVLSQAENSEWRRFVPYHIAEIFLQIFDNMYLSALFICKLHGGHIFRAQDVQRVSLGLKGSLASRLRMLFWIAIGNFVFPILFNIATIIDIFVDPQYMLRIPNFLLTNYYLSIIGVVFATVWSSSKLHRSSPAVSLLPSHEETKAGSANTGGVMRIESGPGFLGSTAGKIHTGPSTESSNSSREVVPLTVVVRRESLQ
ncbi:hypothetical protein PsYK624_138900 [Phanerochaete sordida]|uniref:Uncharacterized protein n=1 Tax=Phanerochaete sordida TaxID=48140 RepID=A0A9P3GQM2_9APHY|nr:hypothetical protein PsYK624_138900 [Phanerochaete sordida]